MKKNLKKIAVIGMRHDLGQNRRGVDIGPSTIRFANLNSQLKELGFEVQDHGDINCCTFETGIMGDPKASLLHDIVKHRRELRDHVRDLVSQDFFPLILGGNHSIIMGSIAGLVSHFQDIGLIYMDAHGDFNTPETSPTGNYMV
ncbi:MAG: arginase family protein [Promethearchaeota archaeon]